MGTNYYDLPGVVAKLEREKDEAAALAAAWEAVTFPTKKNGEPFALMSKNIAGAKYREKSTAWRKEENEVSVVAWAPLCGYVSDSFNAYETNTRYVSQDKLEKTENIRPASICCAEWYVYDLDDIKEAITARVKYWKEREKDLAQQIKDAPQVFMEFQEAFNEFRGRVKAVKDRYKNSDLYYAAAGTVFKGYEVGIT